MKKYLFFLFSFITSLLVISCQDEDFGYTQEEIFRNAYERNFEAKYGKIDPNQSWDLSTYGREHREDDALTRSAADGTSSSEDGWYYVENGTIDDYIKAKLPEKGNNSKNVEEFGLLSGTKPFEIIPLFQGGESTVDWEFHVVLVTTSGKKDVTVFSKSEQDKIQVIGKDEKCPTCQGHRMIKGDGDVTCTVCQGSGYLHGGDADAVPVDCDVCGGDGKVPEECTSCNGRGYTGTCTECDGAGYKGKGTFNVLEGFYKWSGCSVCGGSGSRSLAQLIIGDPGTLKKGDGKKSCTACGGTGEREGDCMHCVDGKRYACGWCDRKGKGVQCPTCEGSGTVKNPNWSNLAKAENTLDVGAIRTKPILVDKNLFGVTSTNDCLIYFYLKITTSKSGYNTKTNLTSIDKYMRVMNCSHPTNINAEYNVKMVACEESNETQKDTDFNDFVCLLVGRPNVPAVVNLSNKKYTSLVEKRYMVEDMGSAVDWDFNDIVVDMTRSIPYTLSNDYSKITAGTATTSAVIPWLGGTAPIQVMIGGKVIGSRIDDPTNQEQTIKQLENQDPPKKPTRFSGGQTGWEVGYGTTTNTSGWDPKKDNITILVWREDGSQLDEGAWKVSFSRTGEVPYIIATDQNVVFVREDGKDVDLSLWINGADTSTQY